MKVPKYQKHSSGQARVIINSKVFYLGRYNSRASKQRYDQIISEWLASGRSQLFGERVETLTMAQLMLGYINHSKKYYSESEQKWIKYALRHVSKLYSRSNVAEFGPDQYETVRETMVTSGLSRNGINSRMKRVTRMLKWGVPKNKFPLDNYQKIRLIPSLAKGRCDAPETDPVKPVAEDRVAKTILHCSEVIADMVRIQLLTSCRPGEVCMLTPGLIDRSESVWEATLEEHKTSYRGKVRTIYIGPEAQRILTPYLLRGDDDRLFQPSEALRKQRASRERKTPLNCGNRAGYSSRTREGKSAIRQPGSAYTSKSYAKAITRACEKAFPYPKECKSDEAKQAWRKSEWWAPNQLRHSAGTKIRKQFGLEVAAILLGHSKLETSQIYAEEDRAKAIEVAAKIG